MTKCKVNKQNREQILQQYIDGILEAMDIDALIDYARSGLEATYHHYTDKDLENEILHEDQYFPWEDFDYIDE